MTIDDAAARWQRIDELFAQALAVDPAERAALLDGLCHDDRAVRAEVEALLVAAAGADDRLRGAVMGAAQSYARDVTAEQAGRRIGPYRLLEPIGEGGMGAVWLAERDDAQFRRRVAIKILRHGLPSADAIARFRDERQILAALEHPGIVRLLDGGTTDDGLPYLVMEHIAGSPLETYARDRSVRDRVELVIRIAEAVQYAHQRLVVHRDLKPGNVLVTRDGTPKLLDFGIAKLLEASALPEREAHTRTGVTQFTPDYASPEQVRGERVDVTTDVYSLGAVAYHLLVGRPPHVAATTHALLLAICDVDAPPMRATRPELPRDLDSVVMKALARAPRARYPSIEQLAADLRRFLEGRPVAARDATWLYRAGKSVRRHRGTIALATAVLTALSATTASSLVQARRADRSAQRARQRFEDVRALANSLIFDVDAAIRGIEGTTAARELVVGRALAYLDRLAADARGDSALARELAQAYMRIGDIQGSMFEANLGQTAAAFDSYRKAGALLVGDDRGTRIARAQQAIGLALLDYAQQDYASMDAEAARALALVAELPADALDRIVLARLDQALVDAALMRGQLADARGHLARLRASVEGWHADDDVAAYWRTVTLVNGAEAEGRAGDPDAAVASLREAVAIHAHLAVADPTSGQYARERIYALLLLAIYQGGAGDGRIWVPDQGDPAAAEATLREALALIETLAGKDRADARAQIGRPIILTALALAVDHRSPADAAALLDRAVADLELVPASLRESTYGHVNEFLTHCAAADVYAAVGRAADARLHVRRGLAIAEGANAPMCELLAGRALARLGDRAEAETLLERAAAALRPRIGEEDLAARIGLAETLAALAELRPADRCELAREALAAWRSRPAATDYFRTREASLIAAVGDSCR